MRTWPKEHPSARLLERKQEAIIGAAKALFLKHGYANTTMEMVATGASVSIMTLYRHFHGKEVLFLEVVQRLCNLKKNNGPQMNWQGEPVEVLRRLGRFQLARFLNPDEVALYRIIMGAMEHFPDVGRMYYQLNMEKAQNRLSQYLQDINQQGTLNIPDPNFSAQTFLILLQGHLIERARLGVGPPTSIGSMERHVDTCVFLFLALHQKNRLNE